MNHIEVRISTSRMEVWGTDAGGSQLKQLAVVPNLNLNFTKGLVWLTDTHYNAKKASSRASAVRRCATRSSGTTSASTARRPTVTCPSTSTTRSPTRRPCATTVRVTTASTSGTPSAPDVTLNTDPVFRRQTPTGAIVTFNSYSFDPVLPSVSVNGNAAHRQSLAVQGQPAVRERCQWLLGRSYWMSVPLEQVHDGVNTLTFTTSGGSAWVANVNVILVAGAPVP